MPTAAERRDVAKENLVRYAHELARCHHPAVFEVVQGQGVDYCSHCGSLRVRGEKWQRPDLHEKLKDAADAALGVVGRKR